MADPPARRGTALASGGSVRRCAANSSVPATHATMATPTPAAGYTSVASSVTTAGPITKIVSSATDSSENAVGSRGEPGGLRRPDRVADGACPGHDPGQPVAAGHRRDQQHRAEAEHGHRHPAN